MLEYEGVGEVVKGASSLMLCTTLEFSVSVPTCLFGPFGDISLSVATGNQRVCLLRLVFCAALGTVCDSESQAALVVAFRCGGVISLQPVLDVLGPRYRAGWVRAHSIGTQQNLGSVRVNTQR